MGFESLRRFRDSADHFNQLGLDGGRIVRELQAQAQGGFDLASLSSDYTNVSDLHPFQVRSMLRNGTISPQQLTPMRGDLTPPGYASSPIAPFGTAPSAAQGRIAQYLANNPFARQQLEMSLGGRILPGAAPNTLRVQPFTPGASPALGSQPNGTSTANDLLAGWIIGAGNRGGSPYMGGVANGLANVLGGQGQGQGFGQFANAGGNAFTGGNGSYTNPSNAGNPLFVGGAGSILGSGSLTVEDKVTLMIMQIMKQMDQQIEQQANYINSLQQQQNAGGKGGGKGGGGGAPSIDVETMKLKRLIDKRSQMFDMLRQIIDKYNETAKNIIQSIGR